MKEFDPTSHIPQNGPVYKDEELIQFLANFHDEETGRVIPPPGFEMISAVNTLLSSDDNREGSIDLYHKASNTKLLLLKDQGNEGEKTAQLSEREINVISYARHIETPFGNYLIGTLPGDAVNARLYALRDIKPSAYFGSFDVIENAAHTLRKIHDLGLWYQDYKLDHFILSSSLPHQLLLYKNYLLTSLTDPEQRAKDIDSFIHSVESYNPGKTITSLREYFLHSYNQF